MISPWARVAFWIVVVGQLIFLLAFIGYKEVDRLTGQEVVLQTVPVDPRSLLQGDYAILDYEIATLPDGTQYETGETVYVTSHGGRKFGTLNPIRLICSQIPRQL